MKQLSLLIIFASISMLFSFSGKDNTEVSKGYINKVSISVDEHIMERSMVRNKYGQIVYDNSQKALFVDEVGEEWLKRNNLDIECNSMGKEMLDENETNLMLNDLSKSLVISKVAETVDYLKQSRGSTVNNMLGNMGNNAMGTNKFSFYLPNKKAKKTEATADEFYQIKIKFIWGGESNWLKFKTKVLVFATKKNGDELWNKEVEVKDFSTVFEESMILESKKGNYFKIKRAPRDFNAYNEEPIGDYASLSKEEINKCIAYSVLCALK